MMAMTATAAGPLKLSSSIDFAFSQAFYYAIFSAGLYFIVATLMSFTIYGAWRGHYDKEFKLTTSQRTLMLQTISFLTYLLVGAVVFGHVEGWEFLDALYWADFTLLTVGIGDFAPATDVGRGLLFPFAIGGIIILGLVIGSIRSLVLERGKVKLGARMVEKERQLLLKKIEKKKKKLLTPITDKPDSSRPGSTRSSEVNDEDFMTERARREKEFKLMRKVQTRAATKRRWTSLGISATTWFALWFAGAAIFKVRGRFQTFYDILRNSYQSLTHALLTQSSGPKSLKNGHILSPCTFHTPLYSRLDTATSIPCPILANHFSSSGLFLRFRR